MKIFIILFLDYSISSAHRDSIKRIQHMDSFGRYISISKVRQTTAMIFNLKKYFIGRNSLYL
jgi:hypothetical protein